MGLNFGTSGIRGLVEDFTQKACSQYVEAFIAFLEENSISRAQVILGGDLRESTPAIKQFIANALAALNVEPLDAGDVPTPALALACQDHGLPGIMITGSHIPADRNGFKFYLASGEILKEDEQFITRHYESLSSGKFTKFDVPMKSLAIKQAYKDRYLHAFGPDALNGLKIGFYQHSGVGRDLLVEVLQELGAEVHPFGRENTFVPVDTEAVGSVEELRSVLSKQRCDAVVSTDGDADRPLFMADDGQVVPGEILGLIACRELKIERAVFPVSCSSSIEKSGWIPFCKRTRIGSPFVLSEIKALINEDASLSVSGFEANGGFLLSSETAKLTALHTRDSLLPILTALIAAKKQGDGKLSRVLAKLPTRVNLSGVIKDFDEQRSLRVRETAEFNLQNHHSIAQNQDFGRSVEVNRMDGLKVTFDSGNIIHLRPSGNAPEFRIYIEASSLSSAQLIMDQTRRWVLAQ